MYTQNKTCSLPPIYPLYPILSTPTEWANLPMSNVLVSNLNWLQFFPCHNIRVHSIVIVKICITSYSKMQTVPDISGSEDSLFFDKSNILSLTRLDTLSGREARLLPNTNNCYFIIDYKCISIDVYSRQLPGPSEWYHFRLLANYFLHFCCDFVFIYLTLLAEFKDPIESRHRDPTPWLVTYSLCPLNSFT